MPLLADLLFGAIGIMPALASNRFFQNTDIHSLFAFELVGFFASQKTTFRQSNKQKTAFLLSLLKFGGRRFLLLKPQKVYAILKPPDELAKLPEVYNTPFYPLLNSNQGVPHTSTSNIGVRHIFE